MWCAQRGSTPSEMKAEKHASQSAPCSLSDVGGWLAEHKHQTAGTIHPRPGLTRSRAGCTVDCPPARQKTVPTHGDSGEFFHVMSRTDWWKE
jgi:hypothetical protein